MPFTPKNRCAFSYGAHFSGKCVTHSMHVRAAAAVQDAALAAKAQPLLSASRAHTSKLAALVDGLQRSLQPSATRQLLVSPCRMLVHVYRPRSPAPKRGSYSLYNACYLLAVENRIVVDTVFRLMVSKLTPLLCGLGLAENHTCDSLYHGSGSDSGLTHAVHVYCTVAPHIYSLWQSDVAEAIPLSAFHAHLDHTHARARCPAVRSLELRACTCSPPRCTRDGYGCVSMIHAVPGVCPGQGHPGSAGAAAAGAGRPAAGNQTRRHSARHARGRRRCVLCECMRLYVRLHTHTCV